MHLHEPCIVLIKVINLMKDWKLVYISAAVYIIN